MSMLLTYRERVPLSTGKNVCLRGAFLISGQYNESIAST